MPLTPALGSVKLDCGPAWSWLPSAVKFATRTDASGVCALKIKDSELWPRVGHSRTFVLSVQSKHKRDERG